MRKCHCTNNGWYVHDYTCPYGILENLDGHVECLAEVAAESHRFLELDNEDATFLLRDIRAAIELIKECYSV